MKITLKILFAVWIIPILLAIIFKIKMFVEIFPIIGTIFVLLLFYQTIKTALADKKTVDKTQK